MEEIIDIDELAEKQQNEKIKEYLKEDESVSKELNQKIEELTNEKAKLSSKNIELGEKEDSLRDKLTHDASTDEIRKVADEIDSLKNDMVEISENIERLEKELKDINDAKSKTEETKAEYKEKISSTIEEYEKKISTIEAAIKVCDNEYLKKAQEEELSKMKDTLNELKEERSKELKEALGSTISNDDDKQDEVDSNNITVDNSMPVNSVLDEVKVSEIDLDSILNNKMDISSDSIDTNSEENISPIKQVNEVENIIPFDLNVDLTLPADDNIDKNSEVKNIQSIELDIKPTIDLNSEYIFNNSVTSTESKNEVIKMDIVTDEKISQIFSSSGIIPAVYDYLDKQSKVGV